ncbi:MAG: YIP1 family protein [Candidatus Micrarchaeia archaeon]|jgi:hypothetical protein
MDLDKMCDTWQRALADPVKFFSRPANVKSDISTAVRWAAIGGVVSVFITELALLVNSRTDIVSALVATIVSGAVIVLLLLLVFSGILFLFARLLGGKGGYASQTYAMAVIQAPLSIVVALVAFVFDVLYAPATYTYGVPVRTGVAGALYGFASFAIMLYGFYAMVISFRSIHKFSTMRALATLLVPTVLLGIIALLALMFFLVAKVSTLPA